MYNQNMKNTPKDNVITTIAIAPGFKVLVRRKDDLYYIAAYVKFGKGIKTYNFYSYFNESLEAKLKVEIRYDQHPIVLSQDKTVIEGLNDLKNDLMLRYQLDNSTNISAHIDIFLPYISINDGRIDFGYFNNISEFGIRFVKSKEEVELVVTQAGELLLRKINFPKYERFTNEMAEYLGDSKKDQETKAYLTKRYLSRNTHLNPATNDIGKKFRLYKPSSQ